MLSELLETDQSGYLFTQEDRNILKGMEPVVEAIARMFGPHCEVLLHSLEDLSRSIVKIANGQVTGRSVGSPITDLALKILKNASSSDNDIIGSYYSQTRDGKVLKSVTTLIRNFSGRPIGFICINLNLSAPCVEFFPQFVPGSNVPAVLAENQESFAMNTEELIHKYLDDAFETINQRREISSLSRNKLIVAELFAKGAFDIKGSIDLVAKELGVSRYTVYNYIREAKH